MQTENTTFDDSSVAGVQVEPAPTAAEPVEVPVAIPEDLSKNCCICGLDLSQKKRARDRSGRHWCTHCEEFEPRTQKSEGLVPCPDCGRHIRPLLLVEQGSEKVCKSCNDNYVAERRDRLLHKVAATAHAETEIRAQIRKIMQIQIGLVALAVIVTLYHFKLLYFAPRSWVPFASALYFCATAALGFSCVVIGQYIRMAFRKRARRSNYDRMIKAAANHILALDEDSHTMGISESPEPLRRRVERAITRIEASAGLGMDGAADLVGSFAKKTDVVPVIEFLQSQRPSTHDTVARNREIATISYLHVDLTTALAAVTAILLRLPYDQDAMTRHALISFRNGQLEQAKKTFKRVVFIAKEKNSEVDLAAAYCNLGMLHVMLNEFDDGSVRYSQAMIIYNRIKHDDGRADCFLNLGLIAYRQKKWTEVEDQVRKAMAINKRRARREGMAICCSLLGVLLVEKEVPELKEAKKLLNQAVRLNLELGRAGGVAAAYGNLGLVYAKRGNYQGATEFFLKAQTIYQRINRPKMTAKIQGMLKTVGTMSAAKMARG